MAARALGHVSVLDLTHYVAGPYCTKLLAGYGAEVIKVERPGLGDGARRVGPFLQASPHSEASALFLYLNTGKKSITLDLRGPSARAIVLNLARQVDVVVESFRPGFLAGLGLDFRALSAGNPRLIMVSVSSFGQQGPYRDFTATEIGLYAIAGLMYLTGEPGREPLKTGALVAQYVGGAHAYVGALAALFARQALGRGQHVDVSIVDANRAALDMVMARFSATGVPPTRVGNHHDYHPWGLYPCRDGYVGIIAGPPNNYPALAKLMGEPRMVDERFLTMEGRTRHRDEIDELLRPWLLAHDKEEIYRAGQALGLSFSYVAAPEDLLRSPQLAAREHFTVLDHPQVGPLPYPGGPFKMSATPWQHARAPLLGEHNGEVYRDRLGYQSDDLARLHETGVI